MLYSKIEGQGYPLLILHGFLGMSDNWKTLGTQFAAEGFEVHMLDLRNHGRSLHSDQFNYKVMVNDILEYCQFHKLQEVAILGHSMGGKLAMFVATSHPEMISKLIVADIAPKYYHPHHQDIMAGLNAVDFSQKPSRNDVEQTLSEYVEEAGTRQFLMKSLYWVEPGQLGFRFNLPVFNNDLDAIGQAIPENAVFNKPTLFLKGENSNYIKDEDQTAIKKHFPNSEIKTISSAGHWLHAENPTDFYNETISFLKAN